MSCEIYSMTMDIYIYIYQLLQHAVPAKTHNECNLK